MTLNIKNEETYRITQELAALTGESMTTAVTLAVRERLERVRSREVTAEERAKRITMLGRDIAKRLGPDALRIEELYGENGLPA